MQKTIRKISYRAYAKDGPIPCIILQGKFLKSLGFDLGDFVQVEYAPGKIVITVQSKQGVAK